MKASVRSCQLLVLGLTTLFLVTQASSARVAAQGAAVLIISEVHPSGSGNGTYDADWFEVTNIGTAAANISGWKVDDSSNAFATALALRGVTSIPAGKSAIFFEGLADGSTDAAKKAAFPWRGSARRRLPEACKSAPTAARASDSAPAATR